MGEAVGQGSGLKRRGPSRLAERLAGFFIPPACREEVLGDLHQRYGGPLAYFGDALSTVPFVIFSRIRRTADAQVVLMEALALYLSFLVAARYNDSAFLAGRWGLLRPALPAAAVLVGLILDDAWAAPRKRSALRPLRGPVFGLASAFLSQMWLAARNAELALPRWILLVGGAVGVLLVSTIRMLFPPLVDRPLGAGGPAFWLQQAGEPVHIPPRVLLAVKAVGILMLLAIAVKAGYRELAFFAAALWFVFVLAKVVRPRG